MKENKKVYLLIIVAMAILSAIAFNNYYLTGYQLAVVIILGALALVAFFLILYSAFKVASVRAMKVGFISGGIFSFIMIFGRSVYNDNTLSLIFGSLWNVLISIVDILGFTIMIGCVGLKSMKNILHKCQKKTKYGNSFSHLGKHLLNLP
jgi:hypothetical protein